jgi:type II secretion system protein E
MESPRGLIGAILVELGHASPEAVSSAVNTQSAEGGLRKLGRILVDEHGLKESALTEALGRQFSLPLMDPAQSPEAMPVDRVSFDFLKKTALLPLSFDGKVMEIAIADPSDMSGVESLRLSFDCDTSLFLAREENILETLDALHASKSAVMQRLIQGVSEEASPEDEGEVSHLKDLAQEKGIIQMANLIIENAAKENSSDIHIEPSEDAVRVRYRIDGILYERELLPVKTQAALASRIKLLSHMNIAERRLPQDGRIRGRFAGREIDIRVSTIPTVFGESIVMRLLDRETSFITLEEIGFGSDLLEKYAELIKKPYGMILMTGPTGSGKSTSLYASLDKINSPDRKIITIEDPVEYLIKGVNQIQVKPAIGLDFASGLRHIVRQDPDVIMVGEIRDLDTASIAVHAALTGHLLFSTLHTNDAPSAITRLAEMGVENYLVASTLIGAAAQRLVRRICPDCKEEYEVPEDIRKQFEIKKKKLFRGSGCGRCMDTGYRGRIAIFELLLIDEDIRELINQRATVRLIRESAMKSGMRTLREDGLNKAIAGITTLDEVMRVTQSGF